MSTIGFIGAGNMAEAILQGIISAGVYDPKDVSVSDIRSDRLAQLASLYQVMTSASNAEVAARSDVLVLSVKPYVLDEALASIQGHVKAQAVIVSIIAGKRVSDITAVLGDVPVIRVMPNTPALINEGASALYANDKARDHIQAVETLFACVGQAVTVDSETLMDAVTAVSGSGPAYYYLLMEKMIEAGVAMGLTPDLARILVLQTAKGACLLASQADSRGETPAELTRKVATPGGTTEAALNAFKEGGFGELVHTALERACTRSQALSVSSDQ
ncbi:MAG: pyrroline-5-carboxylate reductase [Phycisphaerae bacterium]|nr:pyrroline-5-carboxylate reductase [Phycisphaerae bacterium]